jgi:L-ascorbate oxidase
VFAFACISAAVIAPSAQAQTQQPRFHNPPILEPIAPLRPSPVVPFAFHTPTPTTPAQEVTFRLRVAVSHGEIANPSTGGNDKVALRSYNGALTAPTINVFPSQTVRVLLENALPAESEANCPGPGARTHTVPSCLNTTNLHFHGLHVSPTGNSDNVLLEIAPGEEFEYEVNIPADHPAGTFWYHSHRHGSTALQVSSGMVGALIVHGQRTIAQRSQPTDTADIDTILTKPGGVALDENILLFQQVAYACFTSPNSATVQTANTSNGTSVWSCPPGQEGQVQYYSTQFGPGTWSASGHHTLISGEMQPTFPAQGASLRAGDVVRWRMIHAGVRDTINVQIVKATGLDGGGSALPSGTQQQADWVDAHCQASAATIVPQWEFAVDGLTRLHPQLLDKNVLQPAYRSDVLIAFPDQGTYCILDQAASAIQTINPDVNAKDRRLLGLVQVETGTPVTGDIATYITGQLVAANQDLPIDVQQQIAHGDLSAFTPMGDLTGVPDAQIANHRSVDFQLVPTTGNPLRFQINDEIYNPGRVDFRPVVGTTEQWDITSSLATHVFHIHVNPFQIVDIISPPAQGQTQGQSIFAAIGQCTELDLKDVTGKPTPDPQYCGLKGVFRDTIAVKQGYHVIMRTAYTRYIGEFVLHCHILDHEDQGMMLNVEVMPPGGDDAHKTQGQAGGHRH